MAKPKITPEKENVILAALPHVAFDGWSQETLQAACRDAGIRETDGKVMFPRGALDLAVGFHHLGDARMVAGLDTPDLAGMKIREKITHAVRLRLEAAADKEAVRRGSALFAMPQNAGEGTKLIWGTCDAIWDAIGDSSDDVNWYTKRATLSGVYGSTVLFWLGDTSEGDADTWAFLDRRIENVMQFEKLKAQVKANPAVSKLAQGPLAFLSKIKAPSATPRDDVPGYWKDPE